MIMHIQKSIFKHFQKYLGIFRDFHAYSITLTGAYLGEGEEASTALFKNRKTCPDFLNKGHDCAHLWVKFSIQNVVLRLSKKKTQNVSMRGLFSGVFDEICIEVPSFHKPPSTP